MYSLACDEWERADLVQLQSEFIINLKILEIFRINGIPRNPETT